MQAQLLASAAVEAPPQQQTMPTTGPFYSEEHESRDFSGQWGDGIFNCCSDPPSGVMTFMPCLWPVLLAKILDNMNGLVDTASRPVAPLGLNSDRFLIAAYAGSMFLAFLVPHIAVISIGILVIIALHTFRLVTQRYRIPETPACMQFSDVCLEATFLHPCFLSRLWRHVGRARGWVPPTRSVGVRNSETIVV